MACCQSDIAWPQNEKISATVKDVNKKLSKVIPRRPPLQLHHTYYTVISSCHLRSLITAKVEHAISLGCQRTDCTLVCIVVYRITSILYIGKKICPKSNFSLAVRSAILRSADFNLRSFSFNDDSKDETLDNTSSNLDKRSSYTFCLSRKSWNTASRARRPKSASRTRSAR